MKVVKLHGTDLFIVSLEWKIDNRREGTKFGTCHTE